MNRLASEIDAAIVTYGRETHPDFGEVYAYEVDGFGSHYYMDDANIPGLISLPYLGYTTNTDDTYLRTRNLVLSEAGNPWFFKVGHCYAT
jgi:meiotically up-regulated gene 157 (Mug157) protein